MTTVLSNPEDTLGTAETSTLEKLKAIYGPADQRSILRHVSDLDALASQIDELIEQGKPLNVALFWGPHPERNRPNPADKKTLAAVQAMFEGIIETDITIILADYHGRVNGIENGDYLAGIQAHVEMLNAQGSQGSMRAISLDGLYEMFNIPAPSKATDLDPYVLGKLSISAGNFATRAEPEVYVSMRQNELPAVDVVIDLEGNGLLLAITEPDDKVLDSVFEGLQNRLAIIRGANKSGAKMSDTPPWIAHSGTRAPQTETPAERVGLDTPAIERGL